MVERKSTSFRQDWWDSVSKYLKENPQEGFDPENHNKEFIKNILNKYMSENTGIYTKKEIKMMKDL